jgi:hypothetical protein
VRIPSCTPGHGTKKEACLFWLLWWKLPPPLSRLFHLFCRFCKTELTTSADNDVEFKVQTVLWLRRHKHCSEGSPVLLGVAAGRDEKELRPIGSFALKR